MKEAAKGVAAIVVCTVIWGLAGVTYKSLELMGWSVFFIAFFIIGLRTVSIHLLAMVKRKPRVFETNRRGKALALLDGAVDAGTVCAFTLSMKYVSVADASFLLYLAPVWVMILSVFIFRERMTYWKVGALLMAMVGIFLVSGVSFGNLSVNFGVVLSVLGSLFYAADFLLGRELKDVPAFAASHWAGVGSVATMIPFVLLTFGGMTFQSFMVGLVGVALVYGMIKGISVVLYFYSLKKLEASVVGIFSILDAVASAFFAFLIFAEVPGIGSIVGYGLIVFSVLVLAKGLNLWHFRGLGHHHHHLRLFPIQALKGVK